MTLQPQPEPGHIRASDADRNLVADLLTSAYSEGRISRDELDERLTLTMAAKTFDDLAPITADLVPGSMQGRSVGAISTPVGPAIDRANATDETDSTLAIFGATERRGPWRARRRISNLTLFGGTRLDFREATFESDVCEVNVLCLFGGVDIDVPAGVSVRNETVAVFGGTDIKHIAPPQPGAPTLVLKGLVLFGGVTASGKKRRG